MIKTWKRIRITNWLTWGRNEKLTIQILPQKLKTPSRHMSLMLMHAHQLCQLKSDWEFLFESETVFWDLKVVILYQKQMNRMLRAINLKVTVHLFVLKKYILKIFTLFIFSSWTYFFEYFVTYFSEYIHTKL